MMGEHVDPIEVAAKRIADLENENRQAQMMAVRLYRAMTADEINDPFCPPAERDVWEYGKGLVESGVCDSDLLEGE